MIYVICAACSGYLDRDNPICRICGENNSVDNPDAQAEVDVSGSLDEIGEWSHVKREILTRYGAEYAKILAEQRRKQNTKRFIYIDGFAGSGVAVDAASGAYVPGSALLALDIKPDSTNTISSSSTITSAEYCLT